MKSIWEPSQEDNMWAGGAYAGLALCCVPIVPFAVFFLRKDDSPYLKFHGLQASAFGLVMVGMWILQMVIGIMSNLIGPMGAIVQLVAGVFFLLVGIAAMVYWVVLLIQAFQGKNPRIPFVSDIVESFCNN